MKNKYALGMIVVVVVLALAGASWWIKTSSLRNSQSSVDNSSQPISGTSMPDAGPSSSKAPTLPPIPQSLAPKPFGNSTHAMPPAVNITPSIASTENAFDLVDLLEAIRVLESKGTNTLSVYQAKSILAIVRDARSKIYLDEPSAQKAMKSIKAVLTTAQRRKLGTLSIKRISRKPLQSVSPSASTMPDMNPITSPSRGKASVEQLVKLLEKRTAGK